jgi:hypothetical protein
MIASHSVAILVATGLYTAVALLQLFAPRTSLSLIFGVQTDDRFTLLIARHWGLLAALVGSLLVFAAFHPEVRALVVVVAIVEKLTLAGLAFFGSWKRTPAATRTAVVDVAIAVLLLLVLAA